MKSFALALLVALAGCSSTPLVTQPDAAAPVDPLAARLALCGQPDPKPLQAPAFTTDSENTPMVLLYRFDWDKYAGYMDKSAAWQNCILYAAAP